MITKDKLYNKKHISDPWGANRGSQKIRRNLFFRTIKSYLQANNYFEKNAIDLGCGEGVLSKKLATLSNKIILLDYSNEILEECKKNTNNKFEYVKSTLPEINIEGKYDIVYAIESLYYLDDDELRVFFKNIKEKIKLESILIITLSSHRFLSLKSNFEVVHLFKRYRFFLNFPEIFYNIDRFHYLVYTNLKSSNRNSNGDLLKIEKLVMEYKRTSMAIYIFLYPLVLVSRLLYKSIILSWIFYFFGYLFNLRHDRDLIIIKQKNI